MEKQNCILQMFVDTFKLKIEDKWIEFFKILYKKRSKWIC